MSMQTTSTETASVVRSWTETLNNHDPDASLEFMSERCVFINYGTGHHLEGHDEIRGDVEGLLSRWSDLHIDIVRMFVDGDHFAAPWVMTGVHTGDMPGLPATGRSFRIHGVGTGEVRDGKLVKVEQCWNLHEFLGQVTTPNRRTRARPGLL